MNNQQNSQEKGEKNGRIYDSKTDTWSYGDGSGFRTQEQYIRLDLFRDKWKMKFQEGITKGEILEMSEELKQILTPQPESEGVEYKKYFENLFVIQRLRPKDAILLKDVISDFDFKEFIKAIDTLLQAQAEQIRREEREKKECCEHCINKPMGYHDVDEFYPPNKPENEPKSTPQPESEAKKKSGMYGELPIIKIGKFKISMMTEDPHCKKIWITDGEDEGGEFPSELLEPLIEQFFNKYF